MKKSLKYSHILVLLTGIIFIHFNSTQCVLRSRVNDFVGLPKLESLLEEEMNKLVVKDPTYVKPVNVVPKRNKSQDDDEGVPVRDNNLEQQYHDFNNYGLIKFLDS